MSSAGKSTEGHKLPSKGLPGAPQAPKASAHSARMSAWTLSVCIRTFGVCLLGLSVTRYRSLSLQHSVNMADPFEVRMRFTSQLQHLNASVNSSQKAAHYALKYRDMDEDLHSCILEQLERVRVCSDISILHSIILGSKYWTVY